MNHAKLSKIIDRFIAGSILLIIILAFVILVQMGEATTRDQQQQDIPAPKFEKPKVKKDLLDTSEFPQGFKLDGVEWEINYVEHIWHASEEGVPPEDLAGQVCREGKLVAINITKNSIPAAVRMEIIRRLAEVADGDKATVHRLAIENPKLMEWLIK